MALAVMALVNKAFSSMHAHLSPETVISSVNEYDIQKQDHFIYKIVKKIESTELANKSFLLDAAVRMSVHLEFSKTAKIAEKRWKIMWPYAKPIRTDPFVRQGLLDAFSHLY